MSSDVQQQIDYHSERAVQELSRADAAHVDSARDTHLELSRLHLDTVTWLRSGGDQGKRVDHMA
jgi:hypothetical protein